MNRFEISDRPRSAASKVTLNGQDISPMVQGVTVNQNAGELPTVIVRMTGLTEVDLSAVTPRLEMPAPMRALLLAAGWTPPGEGEMESAPNSPEQRYASGGKVTGGFGAIGHTCFGSCCNCQPWQFEEATGVTGSKESEQA